MRLYHRTNHGFLQSIIFLLLFIVLCGCSQPKAIQALISVSVTADNKEYQLKLASGSTVQDALKSSQITLTELDKVKPELSAVLSNGERVKVTRVSEEYYIEQVIIPFEHQELINEALPEGERRLSQPGVNGLKEITYRRVYEDGVKVSDTEVKSVVIKEAMPEVEMIGSRSMFTSFSVPGKLAYLAAGNAWIIEGNTGNRKLVVSTGDLDGRILSLSTDGKYLVFTRFSSAENKINTLSVASLSDEPFKIFDLGVSNIVHFAGFNPTSSTVAYSTVEWREASPGWQANNDLYEIGINLNGQIGAPQLDLPSSSGGIYGWWGSEFSWAPDGLRLLDSRPESIGIFDKRDGSQNLIFNISPYQTDGNWAWVPGAAWSPDGNVVYAVNHVVSETVGSGGLQEFDLVAIPLLGGSPVNLVKNVGMFAYPVTSPVTQTSSLTDIATGESVPRTDFLVAYLQALTPEQSDTSTYQLFTLDRDGSNKKAIFPEAGAVGLTPQHIAWSPASLGDNGNYAIALVYNGNIWIIDAISGIAQQVTGDGLTTRIDWR